MAAFEQVTDHIHRLELPFRVFGPIVVPVAVWLVAHPDGGTLVGSGPPESANELVVAIRQAVRGQGLQRVVLTHAHYDHGGGLAALRLAWNPAIICHRDEAPFVTGEMSYRRQAARSVTFWFGRFFMRAASWQIPVTREVEGGQAADGMAVIHLPGHTPGQIGLLHPQDGAILCGDAIMNLGGRLSPSFGIATPDPGMAEASIVRLTELDYDHLLPSHGLPILGRVRQVLLDYLDRRGTPADSC